MVERIPFLEIVEEGLHWNSRASKHHGAAHHIVRPRNCRGRGMRAALLPV
jgi:hypothetical protein